MTTLSTVRLLNSGADPNAMLPVKLTNPPLPPCPEALRQNVGFCQAQDGDGNSYETTVLIQAAHFGVPHAATLLLGRGSNRNGRHCHLHTHRAHPPRPERRMKD